MKMDIQQLERLQKRVCDNNTVLLNELLESAKNIILSKRYPCSDYPDELENRYKDLQVRIAVDLYNKLGAEGELAHSENGVSRSYGAENVSTDLLKEIVPKVGVI